jgi:hypothetical protein
MTGRSKRLLNHGFWATVLTQLPSMIASGSVVDKVSFSLSSLDRLMTWASRDGESARNQQAQGSDLVEPMAIMDDVVTDGIGG